MYQKALQIFEIITFHYYSLSALALAAIIFDKSENLQTNKVLFSFLGWSANFRDADVANKYSDVLMGEF